MSNPHNPERKDWESGAVTTTVPLVDHTFTKYMFSQEELNKSADGIMDLVEGADPSVLSESPSIREVITENERTLGGVVVFLTMGEGNPLEGRVTRPMKGDTAQRAISAHALTFDTLVKLGDKIASAETPGKRATEERRLKSMLSR